MSCEHCKPGPGKIIQVNNLTEYKCSYCGEKVRTDALGFPTVRAESIEMRWDRYFHELSCALSSKSPCLSRKIGAILVRDRSIISTGYNGPARSYPHCPGDECPRHLKGYKSGEGLVECPAAHAEGNCIANAARIGASTVGCTLYMNCIVPCKDCAVLLVNAGIVEIVIQKSIYYHEMSRGIFENGNVRVREFML